MAEKIPVEKTAVKFPAYVRKPKYITRLCGITGKSYDIGCAVMYDGSLFAFQWSLSGNLTLDGVKSAHKMNKYLQFVYTGRAFLDGRLQHTFAVVIPS